MARLTTREARIRRHYRLRKRVVGRTDRPRLAVYRSLEHIYAQVVDDAVGRTLASASTLEGDVRSQLDGKKKLEQAQLIGRLVGERAKAAGVTRVVFDRGGNQFHGRVKALADSAREAGLEF
jgi:large subunit ribosomal protein L18